MCCQIVIILILQIAVEISKIVYCTVAPEEKSG